MTTPASLPPQPRLTLAHELRLDPRSDDLVNAWSQHP